MNSRSIFTQAASCPNQRAVAGQNHFVTSHEMP